MFAKFSPDGSRVGYVRDNNIYVEDFDTATIAQLTRDGSTTIINGNHPEATLRRRHDPRVHAKE